MANDIDVELHASGAETASDVGTAVDATDNGDETNSPTRAAAELLLEVTAVSGTDPRLDVKVQTSPTGSGSWETVGSFSQATAVGFQRLCFAPLERYYRVAWTIAGSTPSFTFVVGGKAHTVYAVPADLDLPEVVRAKVGTDRIARELLRATGRVSGAVSSSHEMPLADWGEDIRDAVAAIATYKAMLNHGFRPKDYDDNFRLRYLDVVGDGDTPGWLDKIASGQRETPGTDDATADTFEGGSFVAGDTKRGW